jgi:hypothetical protein
MTKVAHKSVVVAWKVAHKSVVIVWKVAHKSVDESLRLFI